MADAWSRITPAPTSARSEKHLLLSVDSWSPQGAHADRRAACARARCASCAVDSEPPAEECAVASSAPMAAQDTGGFSQLGQGARSSGLMTLSPVIGHQAI